VGSLTLADSYGYRARLPATFKEMKSTDEKSWSFFAAKHIFSVSIGLGLIAAGDGLDGVAAVIFSTTGTALQGELDVLNIFTDLSSDAQMAGLSLAAVTQGAVVAMRMTDNAEAGLKAVGAQIPATPASEMSIQHSTHGRLEAIGLRSSWFADSAYATITVKNTGTVAATYRVEAAYPKSFTTVQLWPGPHPFGLGARPPYDIDVLAYVDGIQLQAGEQQTASIYYLSSGQGEVPDASIYYTLTAQTADGVYRTAFQTKGFNTTFIDQTGKSMDHSQLPDVFLTSSPVWSSTVQYGGSTVYSLEIGVQNSFDVPVIFELQQPLPTGTAVVDAADGIMGTNSLLWELDLQPGESRLVEATLQIPVPSQSVGLTNTLLSVYDAVNADWVQLQTTPVRVEVGQSPPPQLEAAGFTNGVIGLNLWTFIPGVYRIEATRDFADWQPLATLTNISGMAHVTDSMPTNASARFYRALMP